MKEMRIFVTILMTLSVASGISQTTSDASAPSPDFSGTWELDRKLSTNHRNLSGFEEMIYIISQKESTLRVARTMKTKKKERTQELIYYTDGRGEKNPIMYGGEKRKSKTSLSNGKLISKYTLSLWISSTNDYYNQDARDSWELSRDGNALIITTESSEIRNLPDFLRDVFKPETYRKVFKRVR